MMDPESVFRTWRADQCRRDAALERKRAHSQAAEDPVSWLAPAAPRAEQPADQKVA